MAKREQGIVCWFDNEKGIGYIASNGQKYIFLHHSDVHGAGIPFLESGQKVEFQVEPEDHYLRARAVAVVRTQPFSLRIKSAGIALRSC
jgi:CspA family cold shock protein